MKKISQEFLPQESGSALEGIVAEPAAFYEEIPVVQRIRTGLDFSDFNDLRALLAVPEEVLGEFLGMSPATLQRRKKAGVLTKPESERLVRFLRLFGLAMEVLGSEEGARSWLKEENPGTAGESPLSYSDTEFGAREVENLLGRLDHGVF